MKKALGPLAGLVLGAILTTVGNMMFALWHERGDLSVCLATPLRDPGLPDDLVFFTITNTGVAAINDLEVSVRKGDIILSSARQITWTVIDSMGKTANTSETSDTLMWSFPTLHRNKTIHAIIAIRHNTQFMPYAVKVSSKETGQIPDHALRFGLLPCSVLHSSWLGGWR